MTDHMGRIAQPAHAMDSWMPGFLAVHGIHGTVNFDLQGPMDPSFSVCLLPT